MRYTYLMVALLLTIVPIKANISSAMQGVVGDYLNNDPYEAARKKENAKGYFERLEERRNIPETKEEWLELLRKTAEYVHALEQQNPGTRAPALVLERVINDGWKNSWSKKNPGWSDLAWGTGIVGGIGLLAYVVVRYSRHN